MFGDDFIPFLELLLEGGDFLLVGVGLLPIFPVAPLKGALARQHQAIFNGRLGELLFHCGRVSEAWQPFQSAFDLCAETNDTEGQFTYLNKLLEVHAYLDDGLAVQTAEQLLDLRRKSGEPTDDTQKRLERLKNGEPHCRVVCVRDGRELELDEITEVGEGSYQFQFRRNRLSLQRRRH